MNIKVLLWFCFVHIYISIATLPCKEYICTREVETLRDYISFRTTRKDDFKQAVDFFKRLAAREGVEITVFEAKPNYPIVILKWPGQDPTLKSVVLLSHIDINSACYEDGWNYPPFSGEINEDCEIVGRGTQAQKSLTIQHYEALRQLRQNNVTLLRTVYIVATSDQTTGSRNGIELFVKTKTFQNMNVGFTLGVGAPTADPEIILFNRFKTNYVIRLDCYGQSSSSAILPSYNDTAAASCGYVLQAYNRYRQEQYRLSLRTRDAGDYTVINFLGGRNIIEYDVIPAHFAAYYAANLALNTTVEDFIELQGYDIPKIWIDLYMTHNALSHKKRQTITLRDLESLHNSLVQVRGWVLAAGGNITVSSIYKEEGGDYYTKTDDSNPYYVAIEQAFEELSIPFQILTTPSTTDTTFVVKAGIPAFGLTPIRNTQNLVYGIDERLPLSIYLEGLRIIKKIISRLANIPDEDVTDDPSDYLEKC